MMCYYLNVHFQGQRVKSRLLTESCYGKLSICCAVKPSLPQRLTATGKVLQCSTHRPAKYCPLFLHVWKTLLTSVLLSDKRGEAKKGDRQTDRVLAGWTKLWRYFHSSGLVFHWSLTNTFTGSWLHTVCWIHNIESECTYGLKLRIFWTTVPSRLCWMSLTIQS